MEEMEKLGEVVKENFDTVVKEITESDLVDKFNEGYGKGLFHGVAGVGSAWGLSSLYSKRKDIKKWLSKRINKAGEKLEETTVEE